MVKRELIFDADLVNTTELVQLAERNEIPGAGAHLRRKNLILALESMSAVEIPNPLDHHRERMRAWIALHWDKVMMQLPKGECGVEPRCFLCPDLQVTRCYLKNRHQIT